MDFGWPRCDTKPRFSRNQLYPLPATPSAHSDKAQPLKQKRPPARPLAYYAECYEGRDRVMAEVYRSGVHSMREVGVYFGVGRMTVSRAVKKQEISRNKLDVRW